MKLHFTRESPQTKYRDYRKFDIDYSLQLDLTFCSIKENEDCEELFEFSQFYRVFLNLFSIQTPLKKKILRGKIYDKNIKKIYHDKT